ncbi:MAG: hypothetical protein JJ896_06070 [Rhodothermales bacterium]|nr:hypothetical protein [Rhodothermales bacterium]
MNARYVTAAVAALCLLVSCSPTPHGSELTVQVTLAESAAAEAAALGLDGPYTGRVLVIVSRTADQEPRAQTGVSGVPYWGMDVSDWQAGTARSVQSGDPDVRGFPLEHVSDLPEGEYTMQALLNVYTRFDRSDGHTVWMHLNSGAGQDLWEAPGNLISEPMQIRVTGRGQTIELALTEAIQPDTPLADGQVLQQGNYQDTDWVKYVKIRSELLSEFWGQDMYIGANVLLPAGYATSNERYPVLYMQGHFPGGRAPLGFGSERGRSVGFQEFWSSGQAPGMIAVSIRDANPYYDTAYSVDSENVGPYGRAITEELIPYLEDQFRMIPAAWARATAGGSTGGWEALAAQIYYPDTFGGAWGWCPDPVDFNYYQIVNIYEDENAYFTGNEWHRVERPNARRFDGNVRSTVRQENHMELAAGPNSRSGGQWAIWEAVFSPVGDDGYPEPIWDPVSGSVNRETAEFWRANYDLHHYLRTNWETVGPKLNGKLHIATGDMDSYYLDNAVYLLDEFLASKPGFQYEVQYGRRKPHCWTGYSPSGSGEDMTNREFVEIVGAYFQKNRRA